MGPPDLATDVVVVTGTRTPERSQTSTVKTDVVTREDAERRGATNVGEALATQPGVRVDPGAYGSIGGPSAIQIQGFDLQRVLILEDNEPVIGDIGGAIDLSNLPIGDIQRIEIVTGPTSALYGSNAIGGVVNILTAPPRLEGGQGRIRLEGRSNDGLYLQGNGGYRRGRAWVGLDASLQRADGIARTPGLPDLQVPDQHRSMIGARGGFSWAPGVDFKLRARWFHDALDGLSTQVAPGIGRYTLDQPNTTDRYTVHAIQTFAFGKGSSLRITLGRQWVDNTTQTIQRGSAIGDRQDRHDRMQSGEAVATIADGPRTWVVGARAEVQAFRQEATKTESLSTGIAALTSDAVPSQTLGRLAGYGQMQWKVGGLTIMPGFRAEHHSRYGDALTPRLALSYGSGDSVVRLSGGRGFRAPTAKELGYLFDHSSLGYRVIGKPDLEPETSWGLNGDVTVRPTKPTSVRVGAFANWVTNLIDIDLAGGVANGAVVDYTYRNFGSARTFGANVALHGELGRLVGDLGYDYLWTRDDVNDRPLGGRPPHTFTASVKARLFWRLEPSARFRYSSDAFVSADTRSPSYATLDVRLAREVWKKADAFVGAIDVTDVHQDPGRVGDFRPPLGRVIYGGLRAEFPWEED